MREPVNRKKIHRNIFYFCLLGISFCLPVFPSPGIVPSFIVLMFLNWIVEAQYRKTYKLVFLERQRFLLFSFSFLYLLYLIGMTYSNNLKYGWEDLEYKLSLLVFPLIFSTLEKGVITKKEGSRVLVFFVIGCLIGTLHLLGRSWYNQTWNHLDHAFYYGKLSWKFHSTYLSMYLAFAVAIIAWNMIFEKIRMRPLMKILLILLSIYFLILIILLSSKAGLLSLALVIVFFSALLIMKKKNLITGLIILVTSLLTIYLGLQFFPFAMERILNAGKRVSQDSSIKSDQAESTTERILIGKSGLEIIQEHLLFGVGTGDVKDELLLKYMKNGIKPAFEKKLNAHNQYIQTFISVGIFGFLLLAGMILLPIFFAFRQEQYLYVVFLLIFALNITFESMLEIQAGVVFYTFFNAFFFLTWKWNFPDSGLNE